MFNCTSGSRRKKICVVQPNRTEFVTHGSFFQAHVFQIIYYQESPCIESSDAFWLGQSPCCSPQEQIWDPMNWDHFLGTGKKSAIES
jgi:hypothetical protein